jgi:phosphoribosyl-ATP pyrophosphohydrolase/phosphoribosyl-AMP cyclohydrolase
MTDASAASTPGGRHIRSPEDLSDLDFTKSDGLVTMVVQDEETGSVLMVAFANREALTLTLDTGQAHFWSRSRAELWRKGEMSGNTLAVSSLHGDCDGDTVLALAKPAGPTCHTGATTCFGSDLVPIGLAGGRPDRDALDALDRTLAARAAERPQGSYTTRLLEDPNLRLKKLGEESAELVAALATGDTNRAVEEAADLLYHVLVALRAEGAGLDAVRNTLKSRSR